MPFVGFVLIVFGGWLIDSAITGRPPIQTLQDIARNPADLRSILAKTRKALAVPDDSNAATLVGNTTTPPATGPWIAPVTAALGTAFGVAGSRWESGHHTGQDYLAPSGTPVHAAIGGTVQSAGWSGPYGNLVTVNSGGGLVEYYGHLSQLAVSAGQTVKTGQLVGYSGATGNVTGPHLHFEVRSNGQPVNPLTYLQGARGVAA